MDLGKHRKPDHVQGSLQVLLGLTGKPDDDICRQGKRWITRPQALYTVEQALRYIRPPHAPQHCVTAALQGKMQLGTQRGMVRKLTDQCFRCLLYTSDAADDLLCVDLGGRRIIKKKKQ